MDQPKVLDLTTIIDPKINFKELIIKSEPEEIQVRFFKRSSGVIRNMKCKYGIKEGIKGTGPKVDTDKHSLIVVFDTESNSYKSIPLYMIIQVVVRGTVYRHTVESQSEKG